MTSLLSNLFLNQSASSSDNVNRANLSFKQATPSIIHNFELPPQDKLIYGFYELNAQFEYGYSSDFDHSLVIKYNLPPNDQNSDIKIDSLLNNQLNVVDRLPFGKRLLTKMANVYYENGLAGVCEELTSSSSNARVPNFVIGAAGVLLRLIDFIHAPINPWLISSKLHDYEFSSLRDDQLKYSVVKVLKWHPNMNKYAIALNNDIVKVYAAKNQAPVILKHHKQTNVTCLSWKPFYSSILAIACADRIIIWDTESLPISIKPASSCSFVLSRRYHKDIVDLQWYPKSDFLLSVASKDNQIIIWDVTMKECLPIKRVGTVGFGLARFSPNGDRLFTADLSTTFRIWNPVNYKSEKWTNLMSRCNSACWSPDGTLLLFSCHDSPLLYLLRFLNNNKQELHVACDLSSVKLQQNQHVGGAINDICWDSTGQRLAISFKKYDNDEALNVVATFITKTQPQFQILPCGLVTDYNNSWPSSIDFKPSFDEGALLTIAWSSSRIQHVPFYFERLDDNLDLFSHQQSIKNISNLTSY